MVSKPSAGGAAFQCGDAALVLLFFVVLLTLVDEVFAAGEHEVHHSSELVGRSCIAARLINSAAKAAIEGTERRAVDCILERRMRRIALTSLPASASHAVSDLRAPHPKLPTYLPVS